MRGQIEPIFKKKKTKHPNPLVILRKKDKRIQGGWILTNLQHILPYKFLHNQEKKQEMETTRHTCTLQSKSRFSY